ncbi:MAG: glycosyltransferase family 4 protein [Flavobacteriales bacterium]|nr:glycosyltransferase family 4 protein [Flavobacteriales bacterium]
MRVLITTPLLTALGGVSSYVKSVIPYIKDSEVSVNTLEVGSSSSSVSRFYPIEDQMNFRGKLHEKPTIAHVNPSLNLKSLIRDGLFLLRAKKHGCLVLVFFHGWDKPFETVIDKYFKTLFRMVFGRADAIIVLASEFEEKLRDWGIDAPIYRETTAVENALIDEFSLDEALENRRTVSNTRVLFLARLEKEKGLFETVEAVALLHKKGLPVSLTIAGDGPAREELVNILSALDLPIEVIHYVGYIKGKNKIDAFNNHDIYCFPTAYGEGLPTSVLEAMAFGLPVVTKPVGGLADVFEDGKMGTLVHSRSPEELAGALEQLITDRDRCESISKYNHRFALDNFMASVVSQRIVGIYNSLDN